MESIYIYFFAIYVSLFLSYECKEEYNLIPINSTYSIIKQLPLGEYLVILNNGIYKYNNDFSKKVLLYEFRKNVQLDKCIEKITLSEYEYNNYLYIFCLIKDCLYLFNYNKTNTTIVNINLQGEYYSLIPYKNNNLVNSVNYFICYFTQGYNENYYFHYHNYEFFSDINHNNILYKNNSNIRYISSLSLSCLLLPINTNTFICFFLSDRNIFIIVRGFDIKNNDLYYNHNYNNFFPKENAGTQKKSIKLILESNVIYVCYFESYGGNYAYKCIIYDYINNKFKEYFKYSISNYNENFNIYYFKKSIFLTYIKNNNDINIIKISSGSNQVKKSIIIDECKYINNSYIIYDNSNYKFNLISDCMSKDDQWNIVNNISISFTSLGDVINKTKEEIIENLDELINSIEIGQNYEIKGEDFTLTIQPTNSSFNESSTHIDFSECENILRQNPNISSSILTILQLEIDNKNDNSLVNQLEYIIYDENKNKVDLSVCKNISMQQYLKLKNDFDVSNYNNYKNSGIDIFNINDSFFNDICHPYSDSESNNDIILRDRIKDIYQNYTLCNDGCSYTEINPEYKTVSCNCQIKTNISLEDNYTLNTPKLDEIKVDSNFALIKCSNLVFSYKGKSKNAGFWIFLFLVAGHIPLIFLYFYKGIKSIKEFIINEMKKNGYINVENNKNKNESNNINLKKIHVKNKSVLHFPPKKIAKILRI